MTFIEDVLANLAAELAANLMACVARHLQSRAFGDPEVRAMARAWEQAFQTMLQNVAANLDVERIYLLDDILRKFVAAEDVASALLDLALEGNEPPLALLGDRFNALGFDRDNLPVDLDAVLIALTRGLSDALLVEASSPNSPLNNRVSVVRIAAIHELLRQQMGDLHNVSQTVVRLETHGRRFAELASNLDELLTQVRTLLSQLQVEHPQIEPGRSRVPFLAPPLPAHFVPRSKVEGKLKTRLLTAQVATPGVLAIEAIHGLGGIGKSTLATAIAHDSMVRERFTDGVLWVELGQKPELLLYLNEWARALDIRDSPATTVESASLRLRNLLRDKACLLLVDDVWQADHARPFLVGGERCRALVTTRDEDVALALNAKVRRLDVLPSKQALALLSKLAGAIVYREQDAARQLAKGVGYLPLALELAGKLAARYSNKSNWQLADLGTQIENRTADQALQIRGQPGLAATFTLSYEQLSAPRQHLFRTLGVFASVALRATAIAGVMACEKEDIEPALDELESLALLAWGRIKGTYTLHPLLRQHAQILLAEVGEVDEAEKRHLAYYLTFARANARQAPEVWDELESELPNLLLAAERAAGMKDAAALVAFEEALLHESRFLYVRGYYQMAVNLLSQSLSVQQSRGAERGQPRTLNKLALFHIYLGQHDEAKERLEAAYSLAVKLQDREQQADSLNYLGILFYTQGKNEVALANFEKELAIRRELGNRSRLAHSHNSLGMMQIALGNYVESRLYFDEALATYEALDDREGVARCIGNRGMALLYLGNYASALKDFENALRYSRELGDRESVARNLLNAGMVQSYLGAYSPAVRNLQAALSLWREMNDCIDEAVTLSTLAEVYSALGDWQEAEAHLQRVDRQIFEMGDVEATLEYLNTRGTVHHERGDYEMALEAFLQMQEMIEEAGPRYFLAQNKLGLARAYLARGEAMDVENAQSCAAAAAALCRELHLAGDAPRAHVYLGEANWLLGNGEMALQECQEAIRLLDEQKHVRGLEAEVYLIAARISAANGMRDRQRQCLERAYDLVQATAAKIEDETWRRSYLAVPVNHQVIETWEREFAH